METTRIHIKGVVQGVGFRPFVYNLAGKYGLNGFCLNDSEGVVIEVQGGQVARFIDDIRGSAPPLSSIEEITVETVEGAAVLTGFSIRESVAQEGLFALVSPDVAVCADCVSEMLDPRDRRYGYPFTNCTNCGPRYSIVQDIPYDRPKTTMAPFEMCPECAGEYHDPSDRRFHAQPNACPACGPRAWVHGGGAVNLAAIREVQEALKAGAIAAIKGLGGFHLACDASNEGAVGRLREKKRRSARKGVASRKPFALMARDMEAAMRFAEISEAEGQALRARARPIVLLKKNGRGSIASGVAPGNSRFGVMLPYTPLHHLLFGPVDFEALVMTSGNLSEEPIAISNEEALRKLSGIAEVFLLHDRDIYMRVDDSILAVRSGRERLSRRARGFVPATIPIGEVTGDIFAAGALLKNTFCLTKGGNAILSQHIGDLENLDALEFYRETLRNLKKTFRSAPTIVAHDLHPDYISTSFALEYAAENGIPGERVVAVQHHHAHIVSAMAEHGLRGEVIGAAFDGTGAGEDGTAWGGEFLLATRKGFRRGAHLKPAPMPGGDAAAREPWRMAVAWLEASCGLDALAGFAERVGPRAFLVREMIEKGVNSPATSSMGRLFDAVASITGLRDDVTFEAEAAIELEAIAHEGEHAPYPFALMEGETVIADPAPMIEAIVKDVNAGGAPGMISARFHRTVAEMVLRVSRILRDRTGLDRIVLSGGVFQNRLLTELSEGLLEGAGFKVFTHEKVPANDGGVSLGQAVSAWERIKGEY